jgi:hypothetical protein
MDIKQTATKLTPRQVEILTFLKAARVIGTGSDGSILESLRRKGLVVKHYNAGGGTSVYIYLTQALARLDHLGRPGLCGRAPLSRVRVSAYGGTGSRVGSPLSTAASARAAHARSLPLRLRQR